MSGNVEYGRQPCPDRIADDVGGAFSMGAVGGSAWHFIRGMKNSPKGERFLGGTQAVRINAPRIGGSFAVWGGLFSTFDCSLVYMRQKEDPWNSIAAGFLTGGFLQLRAGPRSALQSAIFGGVLLGLIEGAGIMLNRMTASLPPPPPPDEPLPPLRHPLSTSSPAPLGAPASALPAQSYQQAAPGGATPSGGGGGGGGGSSWFGGLFGGGMKPDPYPPGAVARDERLDSFDANPAPPAPDFGAGDDSWLKSKA